MQTLPRLFALTAAIALCLFAQPGVFTNRYDRFSTGANIRETALHTGNVNAAAFGKLYSYYVDGAVYAQPLYMPSVPMPGRGLRNVLFVATMNDKVYAFDADKEAPPLWMRDFTNEAAGITPVPVTDITHNPDLNLVGNAGIAGTPVIDPVQRAVFFVARTKENGRYLQRLHKLDLTDGKEKTPPVTIEASLASTANDAVTGLLHFDPRAGNQRPALALVNGMVIIAWASHEDVRPYHGWIMAYRAATLQQVAAFCVTPDGADGGIWQSGRGPAVDAAGAIYFETGNGTFGPVDAERDFGTSLIKLSVRGNAFHVDDYFTPHDYEALNARDTDFGSTGPLLLPGTDLILCGSKKGTMYLLDTKKLGHVNDQDSGIIQTVEVKGGRVLAGPAYWDGPAGPALYVWLEADFIKGFRFNGQAIEPQPFALGNTGSKGSPGGALTVSSDGKKPGTGIVWATLTLSKSADHGNAPGVLRAYHAETLQELWNSDQQPKRDRLGTLVKFAPPLVVGGKVFIANYDNAVNVYGLLPQ